MIVSKQMQDAVGAQQFDLVFCAMSLRLPLPGRDLRAQDDVPEQAGYRLTLMPASHATPTDEVRWPKLIHGEREHVRRAWLAHPPLMQIGHRVLADQEDGQFGEGVDAQPVEHVPGESGERYLADSDA